jgi:hypothetical protein
MKNLGCCGTGDDTDRVLNLVARQPELPCHGVHRLAGAEQVDYVIDAGPAVGEPRPSEGMVGIDSYLGDPVLRKSDELCVAVRAEVDPPQVQVDDLAEDPLVIADHDEFAGRLSLRGVPGMLGIVVQDLGPVGV